MGSEGTTEAERGAGICPECGAVGKNSGPPDPDPDDRTIAVPFECPNCGHEWTEKMRED